MKFANIKKGNEQRFLCNHVFNDFVLIKKIKLSLKLIVITTEKLQKVYIETLI